MGEKLRRIRHFVPIETVWIVTGNEAYIGGTKNAVEPYSTLNPERPRV